MSFEMMAFGAFVRDLAKGGVKQAVTLAIQVRHPWDSVRQVRQEIVNDVGRKLITPERAEELQGLVDVVLAWHKTHGHVRERYDSADWVSLGDGAHMRRKHLDENYEAPMLKQTRPTIEEKLTEENEDEES